MPTNSLTDFQEIFSTTLSDEEKRRLFEKNRYHIIKLALNITNTQLDTEDPIDLSVFHTGLHHQDYKAVIQEITSQSLQTRSPTTYSTTLAALEHSLASLKRKNNFNFAFLSSLLPSLITIEQTEALCNYIVRKIESVKQTTQRLELQLQKINESRKDIHDLFSKRIEAALQQQQAKLEQSKISLRTLCQNLTEARPEVRLTAIEYFQEHIKNEDHFRAIISCLSPIECRLVHDTEKTSRLRTLITHHQDYQTIINEKISSAARDPDTSSEDSDDSPYRQTIMTTTEHTNGGNTHITTARWTRDTTLPSWDKTPSAADVTKFYNLLRLEGFAKFFQNSNRWNAQTTLREISGYKNLHTTSRTAEAWALAAYAINHPEDKDELVRRVIEARMRSSRFATTTLLGTRYFKADSVAKLLSHTGNHEVINALGGDIVKIRHKLGFSS